MPFFFAIFFLLIIHHFEGSHAQVTYGRGWVPGMGKRSKPPLPELSRSIPLDDNDSADTWMACHLCYRHLLNILSPPHLEVSKDEENHGVETSDDY